MHGLLPPPHRGADDAGERATMHICGELLHCSWRRHAQKDTVRGCAVSGISTSCRYAVAPRFGQASRPRRREKPQKQTNKTNPGILFVLVATLGAAKKVPSRFKDTGYSGLVLVRWRDWLALAFGLPSPKRQRCNFYLEIHEACDDHWWMTD